MVARLTPDQKAACSNHVGVNSMFCDQGSSVVSTNPLQLPNLRFPWVKEMHPANIYDALTSHSPFTQPCSSTAKIMKAPGSIPSLSKSRNHTQVNRLANLKRTQKCGTLHDFACHPCAGAMLIFSVSGFVLVSTPDSQLSIPDSQ